jgi:hypothetical protein
MGPIYFLMTQIGPSNVLGTRSNYVMKLTSQAKSTFISHPSKTFWTNSWWIIEWFNF